MSLSSRRNGPGPFGRGSWWEGFRCGSGPGLVRVFVPGGVGRLRHGRAGGGAVIRSAPRARAPGSALPAPGEDPPFDAVRDPDGGACGVRIRSGWTLDEENRHRSRAPHAVPLCPVGAFESTIRGRVGRRPGARPRARPAVVRTSGGAVGPVLTRPAATIRGCRCSSPVGPVSTRPATSAADAEASAPAPAVEAAVSAPGAYDGALTGESDDPLLEQAAGPRTSAGTPNPGRTRHRTPRHDNPGDDGRAGNRNTGHSSRRDRT